MRRRRPRAGRRRGKKDNYKEKKKERKKDNKQQKGGEEGGEGEGEGGGKEGEGDMILKFVVIVVGALGKEACKSLYSWGLEVRSLMS
eukprot:5287152-Heterocapsa_arctica.AAC.1